nr:MAG TPA: hypothetical protein [Crassvirales sp.]
MLQPIDHSPLHPNRIEYNDGLLVGLIIKATSLTYL